MTHQTCHRIKLRQRSCVTDAYRYQYRSNANPSQQVTAQPAMSHVYADAVR